MTRSEVAKRLAIKAMTDTTPRLTYRNLARLFSTSFSAVRDALRQPVAFWASMMADAPAPSKKATIRLVVQPVTVISPRPGSRERARLTTPEPTIIIPERADFEVDELEIDQDAIDRNINEKIEERDWKICHGLIESEEIGDDS